MEHQAHEVIYPLVITKGMMPTLMGYDPDPCKDTTLEGPIDWPRDIRVRIRQRRNVSCGNVVEQRGQGDIIDDIRKGPEEGSFKTMRWDGVL